MSDEGKIEFSLDELISMLERSSLPTIIVEGKDDIIIYRKIESLLQNVVDVLPVGGRPNVLGIFDSIKTNPSLQDKKLIFIADKDTWVNTGIPSEYQSNILIFTHGYSIENDIFIDFCCKQILENDTERKMQFENDKNKFIHWYALALQANLCLKTNGVISEKRELAIHPKNLLNNYISFTNLLDEENYPLELEKELNEEYEIKIRGKSLINLFIKTFKEYNAVAMFQAIAVRPGSYIQRIFNDVTQQFKE